MQTLRVLGTNVTLNESIRSQAEQDLGIKIEYLCHEPQVAQRIAVLNPESYDLYDQWFHNVDYVWPVRSIKPIETEKLLKWSEIGELAKIGRISSNIALAPGCSPHTRLYVQEDGELGCNITSQISMLPLMHNVDSFVYFPDLISPQFEESTESWAWLFNPEFYGRVAVQSDAAIGALDLAMALSAKNNIKFNDLGNLSIEEIDFLTSKLLFYAHKKHFQFSWSDNQEAYFLLKNKDVKLSSVWSPTMMRLLKEDTLRIKQATPKEGYRGWYGGICFSKNLEGELEEVAYSYLNWWLSGWAGAQLAKKGLYFSIPNRVKDYLSDNEWNYWYMGQAATESIYDIDGEKLIDLGHVRDGGSYEQKMSKIGVWNSVMDEHNYLVRKWKDVIAVVG